MNTRARAAMLIAVVVLLVATSAHAQQRTDRVRGSWVGDATTKGGVVLAKGGEGCEIVHFAPGKDDSPVAQAARFLAADIERISGYRPPIVKSPTGKRPSILLYTDSVEKLGGETPHIAPVLRAQWEAFQISALNDGVRIIGSDPRGTAFGVYTLCERLGIDPLYHWTGYVPEHHDPLVLKPVEMLSHSPTFRYRGMFHDDEDILPRPFDAAGYPYRFGDVPTEWYAKYFETALRLRMNMVAPYTRVHRREEVQKMASDWGLFYTSHHYDILLSNPFGWDRYGLAAARGVSGAWDFLNNRDNLLRYWRGGVEENKDLDCIYPVGLRGTDDVGYRFPSGTPQAQQAQVFKDAIAQQVKMVRDGGAKTPLFHFTLYTEMLPKYQSGQLDVPKDVIIVWPDNNDGVMRGLPTKPDQWKHGVYYHLAYLGKEVKQSAHVVSPQRIAEQFRRITDAGSTEYMLVNVSELREFVMEARMLAEICWDAKTALAGDDPAKRYTDWWCREYFGDAAAPAAANTYADYAKLIDTYDKQWAGSDRVHQILSLLSQRFGGKKTATTLPADLRDQLRQRNDALSAAAEGAAAASKDMSPRQEQFFFDHAALPLLFEQRTTECARQLLDALDEKDNGAALKLVRESRQPLEQLEVDLLTAEHPPFENWYRETWIRRGPRPWNLHRPYRELRAFLASDGKQFQLLDPEPPHRSATAPTTGPAR